jgi:hypothetical protein
LLSQFSQLNFVLNQQQTIKGTDISDLGRAILNKNELKMKHTWLFELMFAVPKAI